MTQFIYKDRQLYGEDMLLSKVSDQYGTPCFVYSEAALEENWQAFSEAFADIPHRLCYAVKANSNLAILHFFAKKNAGFDIVSLGELERVLAAKGNPQHIVFSGVGKRAEEIHRALEVGVGCFDVESLPELERIHSIAKERGTVAPIALRVNPNIDALTHPYISTGLKTNKFGIDYDEIVPLCEKMRGMPHLKLKGIACHIGSQLTSLVPFTEAANRMADLFDELKKSPILIEHMNLGGGLGVQYQNETPPVIKDYVSAISAPFSKAGVDIIVEPGRALVANTGVLLTRVEYIKKTPHKNFVIVDAGMNDFMRPALYDAWHDIIPLVQGGSEAITCDVVGPVCESADVFGRDRVLAAKVGDLLAIKMVGAYGFSMGSNYNSRPRAAEVMVKQNQFHLIRKRETIADLFANEQLGPLSAL